MKKELRLLCIDFNENKPTNSAAKLRQKNEDYNQG